MSVAANWYRHYNSEIDEPLRTFDDMNDQVQFDEFGYSEGWANGLAAELQA
jgi:hypothetical protein